MPLSIARILRGLKPAAREPGAPAPGIVARLAALRGRRGGAAEEVPEAVARRLAAMALHERAREARPPVRRLMQGMA
ncbi:MAG: hypothetical protein KF887_05090 [Paracoccaceae bacterium]|nr:MAG: hypothetical protein KF887_05090 [Paracoccaceae bacterium]